MALRIPRPMESSFPEIRVPTGSPAEAYGGGQSTADAYGATGQLANEIGRQQQEKLEQTLQTAADEELNALTAEETRLTTELQKVKGKDAFAAAGESLKNFDKFQQDRDKNIANPLVKRAVSQRYQKHRMQLQAFGMRYSNAEGERWQDETDQAKIVQAKNAALANSTPERVAQSLSDASDAIDGMARRKGTATAFVALQKAAATSDIHAGVLQMMLDSGSDLTAKAYYDANKGALVGNDAIRMARLVQQESTLGEAQRQVDRIFSTYYDKSVKMDGDKEVSSEVTAHYAPDTEAAALEDARKIKDPEVRALAERMTKERWNEQERAQADAKKKLMLDAANILDSAPGKKYEDLPSSLRDQMTHTERKSLQRYASGEAVTDDADWYSLMLMSTRDPEAFKRENLLNHKLSRQDLQEIGKLQVSVMNGDMSGATGFRTIAGITSSVLREAKLTDAQEEQFTRVLRDEVLRAYPDPKKKPTNQEIEKLADDLLKTRPAGFWSKKYREFELLPMERQQTEEKKDQMIQEMDPKDRLHIMTVIDNEKLPLSKDTVIKLYESLQKDRAAKRGK